MERQKTRQKNGKIPLKNKRVLITGGGGSIWSELVRQLSEKNKVFILDNNETATFDLTEELKLKKRWVECRVGDIRNRGTTHDVFSDFKPQIVFHAAAYKHVTPMEAYPEEAVETNIIGTLNVLREAQRWECLEKFIFISTDKVVHSNSIMGATKRVGEIIVKNKGGIVVRFGNVLGSRGSVIPLWQASLNRGEPLNVTSPEMTRFFMTIPEACELVIHAAEEGRGGEIFILDMGQPVNVLDLAKKIISESGKDIGINIIGVRPGETMHERLMTLEEEKVAIKKDNYWIIK